MTIERECPNCGAAIRDDGVSPSIPCTFCGTHVAIERKHGGIRIGADGSIDFDIDRFFGDDPGVVVVQNPQVVVEDPRPRLEAERRQLAAFIDAKADEYRPRIIDARAHRIGNYIWPPFFGCTAGVATFVGGALFFAARYADNPQQAHTVTVMILSAVAFLGVLILVALLRRRPGLKPAWQLEQERDKAVYEQRKRLEAIDTELGR